ncbi:unnamed protein product [Aureobasidium uvarum]|uniref:Uncharacterized protein n=1 Tax=Aureobasidium uvarum TaxID=2773716 RepID=A0A9N8KIS2_9PEZI|nr:unnamed protein product [Aureobasidium uvarum]
MSVRISFTQALRGLRLQKTLRTSGSSVSYNRPASQPWLASSACYYHVTSRFASTAIGKNANKHKQSGANDDRDPVELFNTHLQDGTLTKPMAQSYLKTVTRQERYDGGLGEATIKWMWNEHDSYEFPRDTSLLDHMVRHLVREGKEELVWKWIEQKSRKSGNLGPTERFVWRADTVKALIGAKAFASDRDSLDGALETFFRAKSSTYSIPLSPARMNCATLLMMPAEKAGMSTNSDAKIETPRWPNTSVKLWEDFLENVDARQDISEPFQVQLPLYHPEGPNPVPYLKHCRKLAKDTILVQRLAKRSSVTPWIGRGKHAEAVLRQQGHDEDANWLKDFLQNLHTRSEPIRKKEDQKREKKRGRNGPKK